MAKPQSVSVAMLKAIADAFNARDLDAIMEFFADDCSLDMTGDAVTHRNDARRSANPSARCDHWQFRDGKVIRKDSYWKIVDRSS